MCQHILLKLPNAKFVENPLSGSPPVTCRQTDRHTLRLSNILLQMRHKHDVCKANKCRKETTNNFN